MNSVIPICNKQLVQSFHIEVNTETEQGVMSKGYVTVIFVEKDVNSIYLFVYNFIYYLIIKENISVVSQLRHITMELFL